MTLFITPNPDIPPCRKNDGIPLCRQLREGGNPTKHNWMPAPGLSNARAGFADMTNNGFTRAFATAASKIDSLSSSVFFHA